MLITSVFSFSYIVFALTRQDGFIFLSSNALSQHGQVKNSSCLKKKKESNMSSLYML